MCSIGEETIKYSRIGLDVHVAVVCPNEVHDFQFLIILL
jgi:hypothetical protein